MKSNSESFYRIKQITAFFLLLVMTVFIVVPTFAAPQREQKIVRVGWYDSPFNKTDSFGRRSGYAYEYQQKIAAYTGWIYEYVEGSWSNLMDMLKNGEIDLMSDVSYTKERTENMLFSSIPMGTEDFYLFIEPDKTASTSYNYEYLSGKRLGVSKDSVQKGFLDNWLKSYGIKADVTELTCTENDAFNMLKNGELYGYVALDAYRTTETAVPKARIGSSDFFFAVNKSRPDLLKELNVAIGRIQDENRFYSQQLFQKYINASGANIYLSDAELKWLETHDTIRVAYQENHLAFCATDKSTGQLTGILKEYLENASGCLANATLNFEPIAYPSAEDALEALKKGDVDCVFPSNLSVYDGETMGVLLTPPIIQAEAYILVRKSDKNSFFEKEKVTIAAESFDINYHTMVLDLFPGWHIKMYTDTASCLKAVSKGKADCYLTNNYQYNSLGKECESLSLTILATGKESDFSIAVFKENKELYSILTRTTSIVSDTIMNSAMVYYTAEGAKFNLTEFLQDNMAVIIFSILIIIAMFLLIIFQQRIIAEQRKVEKLNKKVFVDALTHVRNKGGFDKHIQQLQEQIDGGETAEIAIGVFDCNDLKLINDRYGHDKGNIYLKTACSLMCRIFQHSPVFRIGGDEFTVILKGEDCENKKELTKQFEEAQKAISESAKNRWEHISVAMGIAEYDSKIDDSLNDTFRRADKLMYENKKLQKQNK